MAQKYTTREEDYSKWYNELVARAELAENSGVRGCMVIKPYGYAIWEKIQAQLDKMFKETGHQNAYFPLFVPKSMFEAEEKNAEGFAKECAVVTHYRLKTDPENPAKLIVDPEAKLEEELIVRPTSEAIIWSTYKNWIQSYRDLPILINQWANVVRWEMRTRIFLRTAEFLWQEGHTAHATKQEAIAESELMLDVYTTFVEQFMAMPVIRGRKTESERFAGADDTYCIEAMMQDGKALQAGTSHFLGQNFAKAFDVKFADKEGKLDYVWATSWGVSTRLMGALIMTHSDDEGLVLPPALAPIQVVIVPINVTEEITEVVDKIQSELRALGVSVKYDDDDNRRPGWKFAEYEAKGVPVRLAVGPRDLANGVVEVARRDTKEKFSMKIEGIASEIKQLLDAIQTNLYETSLARRTAGMHSVDSYEEFKTRLEADGGFYLAHWDGTAETEEKVKKETQATIRCIPLDIPSEPGVCMVTGKPSAGRVVFAKAY
ncbi:MAG: proline--tRNA ligase [Candidatus Fluviicola riflensis]|nr:MAG: proline--tRNA ligase [Candidatus Fluviicola riflensis]OGS79688.1 MAG: proline--tRNA ligase [Candidatus Fluviicola riflensis]OGS87119.1 MAG: proline--tRNA ligase [Fluviicola sp. RIFCSPHIGHO2_01_FULL_43_53]OGS89908.1 MAG: proline--tRNA ligase [Fluviicola sp. RIFCSPHIGHO2_12_FULL_43_24]